MRYVALWKGINVGKAKCIAMADLKALLAGLGATDVTTVLNSGNAVFTSRRQLTGEQLRQAVAAQLGVDAAVIVKTAADWAHVAQDHGMAEADDPGKLLVAVAADAATLKAVKDIATAGDERVVVTEHAAYLWCAHGILQSKAGEQLLKRLGDHGTTRNWATVQKINALLPR